MRIYSIAQETLLNALWWPVWERSPKGRRYIHMWLVAQSCPTLCDPMVCSSPGSSVHGDSPGKNTGEGCHALLQGIFLTERSNSDLLHCRHILYHLICQGSPRILEWVVMPFSRGYSWPRNQTRVSCITGGLYQLSHQGRSLCLEQLYSQQPRGGFPCGSAGKESAHSVRSQTWVWSLGWGDPLEKGRLPTPVFWPGEFYGLYSTWGLKELDTTEQFSLSLHFQKIKHRTSIWSSHLSSAPSG